MFHGIYMKNRPKSRWHLVSIAISPEAAAHDMEEALNQARSSGLTEAKVAEQLFDSAFWIPHYLTEIKETKSMYN